MFGSVMGSSTGLMLSAVVSQSPGYAGSFCPGRYGVEVNGGICRESDTSGLNVSEEILEADMLVNRVQIALARDDWFTKSEYKLLSEVPIKTIVRCG